MNKWGINRRNVTFDVYQFFCYNKNINGTLRKNVFLHPQLKPLETLRNRGKLTHGLKSLHTVRPACEKRAGWTRARRVGTDASQRGGMPDGKEDNASPRSQGDPSAQK
jgi:hypothetical protein